MKISFFGILAIAVVAFVGTASAQMKNNNPMVGGAADV
jgi:hypothetical protein